jgi:hypothetical protein
VRKEWHRHLAAGFALLTVLVALWSAGSALGQAPTDADIRAALKADSEAASEALNEGGLDRLREKGRFSIKVKPLVAGKLIARVKAKSLTAAYGERQCPRRGSYRLTLRVTRAGRRYQDANPTAKQLQLRLSFRAADQ